MQLDGCEIEGGGNRKEQNGMSWNGMEWNVGKEIMLSTTVTKTRREIHMSHNKSVFVFSYIKMPMGNPVDTLIVTEKYRTESQRRNEEQRYEFGSNQ